MFTLLVLVAYMGAENPAAVAALRDIEKAARIELKRVYRGEEQALNPVEEAARKQPERPKP